MTTNGNPQVNLRNIVLTMLCKVEDGAKSHIVLKETLDSYDYLDKQKRAFVTVLFKGTIERQIELDYIINQFSKTKVNKMKPVIRDLVMPHVENHERILEAAMKPNFGLAYEAFMNDPLVHGRISREDGEKLLKEMIQNTLDVLPEGWKKEIQ